MTSRLDVVPVSPLRRSPDPAAVFAPWTLARVAGLPADTCDLVSAETADLLERCEALAAELPTVGEPVANACYDLVPSLDDAPMLRRLALAVKRAAHKGSDLPNDAEDLTAHLPARVRGTFTLYRWKTAELARLREELTVSVASDSERARAWLIAQLKHDPFVRSLALAAPGWARHGLAKARTGRLDARNLRTLYSYVTRTALKTSPYAQLTTVALPGVASTEIRSYAGAAVAYTALHAVARDRELARLLRYRVAPHTARTPGGFLVHGHAEGLGHLPWMSASVAHDDAAPAWLFAADNEHDYHLGDLLTLLGGKDPWARYLRMLDSGWIFPVACWPGTDPLGSLLSVLEGTETDHPLTRHVRQVQRAARDVAGSTVTDRTAAVATVQQAQTEWRAMSGLRLWTPDLVYEDAATGFAVPDPLDAETGLELTSFAEDMRPHVFRSHLYDFLLEAFVSRFGRGGRCHDVFGFLAALTVEDRAAQPMAQAEARDREGTDSAGRAHLPVGITSAPPTTAVLVQVADTERGRFLVVNQLCDGVGGLVSRFTGVLGDRLSGALHEWFSALWPDVAHHEIVPSRACTTAQHTSAGLLPALTVPGDGMSARPGDLLLESTTLVHDPDRDVLELLGPDDRPVGLAYLGLVPTHLSVGLHRLLSALANPWVLPRGYGDRPFLTAPRDTTEVVALPRRTVGRTVVERASWLCPVDRLPLPRKGESESDMVLRANRWRREHGIPAEVFCRRVEDFTAKPLWTDLRSAVSLAVLRQELPEHGWVRVTEALPGSREHSLRSPSGQRLASEYAVGLRWPRPGATA
ncbi:hypothetical protein [Allokutzneria oryzae]|uniref:Lantibiotic dehydratase N-terminal domain-containing protein n=1 Tax=Allokutzneria oryzae TaxID=1378989 RepID=A0ABV5ZVD9_9PSEU